VSDILVGDPHTASPVLCALSDEVVKLEEVVRLFRLLVVPDESEEAAEPIRLVKDAISLAGLHPDLGGVVYTTAGGGEAPPILARPVALTHEILIALTLAASDSKDGSVLVELYADGDGVSIVAGRYAVSARNLTAARQATA
jgi:hypothetical protein